MNSPFIIALDCADEKSAVAIARQLDPSLCRLKVGKELYTHVGPKVVESLQTMGFEIFLDLKFHDIPNTVKKACHAAAELGVWMVNVHASGGRRMMEAAMEGVMTASHRPLLTAVTVLTSMTQEDLEEVGLGVEPEAQVLKLAALAERSGLDGIVCSAQEATVLRAILDPDFLLVTPGIRPEGAVADDQRRIVTPADAMRNGSNYLVVGRPVTQTDEPLSILRRMIEEVGTLNE